MPENDKINGLESEPNDNATPVDMDASTYIDNLKALKESTVDKKEYQKLVEENKKLSVALLNGETFSTEKKEKEPTQSIQELNANFRKDNQTNLEFWKNTLKLRDAVIDSGKPDPFLPVGHELIASEDDKEKANRVADVIKNIIEESEDSPEVFNALLQKTLVDDPLLARKVKA